MSKIDMDVFKEISLKDLQYARELSENGEYQKSYSAIIAIIEKLPQTEGNIANKTELLEVLNMLLLLLLLRMDLKGE